MRSTRLVVLLVSLLAALGVVTAAPAGASPGCSTPWGSLPESSNELDVSEVVVDVRAGRHTCFDRLVVDLGMSDNRFGTYDVRYVSAVRQDGSGHAVPVRGGAVLRVRVAAPAYDEDGDPTVSLGQEMVDVGGFTTFRQVASAGSYEGWTTLALGVRARLPFRVFVLPGAPYSDQGPRVVVDVAHRW
jgi:hypothetical protein